MAILTLIYKPLMPGIQLLKKSYPLFTLSLQATILILTCALLLYKSWVSGGKKNQTHLIWSIGFFSFSILFIGLMLEALGLKIGDMHQNIIFFAWRQFQIIWAVLILYGILKVINPNEKQNKAIAIITALFSYSLFVFGLIYPGKMSIEWTMYGFLFLVLIPVTASISYLFYIHTQKTKNVSSAYLSAGFAGIAITYAAWAPWHLTTFYFVWFGLFILSLIAVLIGIVMIKPRTYEAIYEKPKQAAIKRTRTAKKSIKRKATTRRRIK